MSHSRHESGEISSATTIRIISFSHSRPVSILKSTSRMPTPRNRPERKSLTRMASAMTSSISCGVAQPKAVTCSSETMGSPTGRHIAYHHFEGNDLPLANQLLAHVESLDEVSRNSDVVQVLEDVFG